MPQSLRHHRLLAASLGLGLATAHVAPAAAETLYDAIAEAYQNNPNLQSQRASQRVTDETYAQARSGWRPTLTLDASATYQERRTPPRALSFGQSEIERGNSGALQLTFRQPIWTGGRTAAAVTAANADVLQGRENLRRLESQVMQAVIQAYVDVRRDQESLLIRQENVKVLQAQLEESQARFDVGEITRTDVALSQARLAASQSLLQSAQAQLAISRSNYATLVGRNPGDLAPEPSLAYLMPGNVDDAFNIAEQNSPLLRAQLFAEQASRARIAGARAERMPNVTLQASGLYSEGPIDNFDRGLYRRDATAAVGVTVPLFNGGLTTSRIRQAIERNNVDRITVETQRRGVLQTITQAWNQLLAARSNIVSTDEQVRAAKIAAEGTHQEEQVGLRSTLDVLNAEQELRAAQLSQVSARHDEYTAAAAVLTAMGRLEARNLIPREPQYDPRSNFRKLRITWGWTPWEEPISALDGALAFPTIPRSHDLAREPAIAPGLPGAAAPAQPADAQPSKAKPPTVKRAPLGLYN
ncbi:TolC family outer membrane protein [Phenylobacterium sp. LjRoot225]|uniref:TolC family outer membrane protein n=1 Tax=Phenylobacterium sp. LjRoot225 TaxID=3342285 RepID=UPI003ECC91DE